MTHAVITTIMRRDFGINTEVHIARCSQCGWRSEVRELALAQVLVRGHVCGVTA